MSPYYGRSDMAAEYYDRHLFNRATFGDLAKSGGRPFLAINATDMAMGEQFTFGQFQFSLIGSDLSSYPISRAVAASTAFPLLLTPITLRNYAGRLGGHEPNFSNGPKSNAVLSHRERQARRIELSYLDSKERPYIHLADGGISDNLGLQTLEDASMTRGGLTKVQELIRRTPAEKLVLIVVNAATHRGAELSKQESVPGLSSAWGQLTDDLDDRMNYESLELLRQTLQRWREEGIPSGRLGPIPAELGAVPSSERDYYLITVSFNKVRQPADRQFFENLPTNLNLPGKTVDRLVEVAGVLLRQSTDYQRLLHDLGSGIKTEAGRRPLRRPPARPFGALVAGGRSH